MDRKNSSGNVFVLVVIGIALLGLGAAVYFFYQPGADDNRGASPTPSGTSPLSTTTPLEATPTTNYTFSIPKKSVHYEGNIPKHGAILAGVPVNVVIDFNFDLADISTISIKQNDVEYGVGETTVDINKLSMRRAMDPDAPDGLYTVTYNACWPDLSCHDGHFQFAIDRNLADDYMDMTGQTQVNIQMDNLSFIPEMLLVDQGTTVTWTNLDSVTHYVNTDSHPAHTYLLDMNSNALENGGSYSYIFDQPGIYPYHCSAHASAMTGTILVK